MARQSMTMCETSALSEETCCCQAEVGCGIIAETSPCIGSKLGFDCVSLGHHEYQSSQALEFAFETCYQNITQKEHEAQLEKNLEGMDE